MYGIGNGNWEKSKGVGGVWLEYGMWPCASSLLPDHSGSVSIKSFRAIPLDDFEEKERHKGGESGRPALPCV